VTALLDLDGLRAIDLHPAHGVGDAATQREREEGREDDEA